MDRYEVGRLGEESACTYLRNNGYEIVGRNVRVGNSEFDIICNEGRSLVFVEVKTRVQAPGQSGGYGRPIRAVDRRKSEMLVRGMLDYIHENQIRYRPVRIDVIEVYADVSRGIFGVRKINHVRSAVRQSDLKKKKY